jgi:Transposase, Mutator family
MARRGAKPTTSEHQTLRPLYFCWSCKRLTEVAYSGERRITHLTGMCHYTVVVHHCTQLGCPLYRRSIRPDREGLLALPHGEFGLDVIAQVGYWRFAEHRSVPEIHQALVRQEVRVSLRTVTNLLYRYEELLTLRLTDPQRLAARLGGQGRVVLALDGLQPDKGQEVLWVLRDCLSGEVLLARSLLSSGEPDLAPLLREVVAALPVPIIGVISDGQVAIRHAVQAVLPTIPHQLCQFHYLRDAAAPVYAADRHVKKELKKQVRGIRPIERALEGRTDAEAVAVRGYCLAVRRALGDDGRPPLEAAGVRLQERLTASHDSASRVVEKGGPVKS